MMPPLMTVGSNRPASSSAATIDVVVVLPWVPAMGTQLLRRISSASISARRTTGMRPARAAVSSGLSRLMADETTTTAAPSTLSAACPTVTAMPFSRRRLTLALSATSEPRTAYPRFASTSAMPLMPMPPMPTKWIGPMSRGSFMAERFLSLVRCARFMARLRPWRQPGDLHHQIGEALSGIGGAGGAGGGRHGGKARRVGGERRDLARQAFRRKRVLAQEDGAARRLEHAGVGELVLIERVG